MNPEQILSSFREALGEKVLEDRTIERSVGVLKSKPVYDIWLVVGRDDFHDVVAHLCAKFDPHLSVISGEEIGNDVALNYHFSTGWGEHYGEATFTIRTLVPIDDRRLPSICDLLPGAQTSEREKREFFGLEIEGIPDDRNIFLPEGSTLHPWSKEDDGGTSKELKRLVKWEARDE